MANVHPTIKNFDAAMQLDPRAKQAGRLGSLGEGILNKPVSWWLKAAVFIGVSYWALRYIQGEPWSPKDIIGKTRGR